MASHFLCPSISFGSKLKGKQKMKNTHTHSQRIQRIKIESNEDRRYERAYTVLHVINKHKRN